MIKLGPLLHSRPKRLSCRKHAFLAEKYHNQLEFPRFVRLRGPAQEKKQKVEEFLLDI